jgi:hypothetical protein
MHILIALIVCYRLTQDHEINYASKDLTCADVDYHGKTSVDSRLFLLSPIGWSHSFHLGLIHSSYETEA